MKKVIWVVVLFLLAAGFDLRGATGTKKIDHVVCDYGPVVAGQPMNIKLAGVNTNGQTWGNSVVFSMDPNFIMPTWLALTQVPVDCNTLVPTGECPPDANVPPPVQWRDVCQRVFLQGTPPLMWRGTTEIPLCAMNPNNTTTNNETWVWVKFTVIAPPDTTTPTVFGCR